MGWLAVKAVLDGFSGSCSEKLCLVALAEWSDDNGLSWPSVDSIARRMCVSRSQAQRTLRGLIEKGVVSVAGNLHGGAPGSTRRYQIDLQPLTGRMDATGSANATGRTSATPTGRIHAQEGPHPCTETGRMDATQTTIEPSKNQEGADEPPTRPVSTKVIFQKWFELVTKSGEPAITAHSPTWDYAQRVGLPDDLVALAWFAFKRRYTEGENYKRKKYVDWRQTFRNALEGNWLKLWYATGNGYELTTKGVQAQRELDALQIANTNAAVSEEVAA